MSNASQEAAIQSQISSAQSKKEGYLEEAKKVKEIYDEIENKALEMDGLIGQQGILLNNISGWIEGFFN